MMKKFINILNNLPEWAFLCIYLLSILCYTSLIGLQGLDIKDEGWISTGFAQIYNDASTISGMFTFYNTLLVGGLFHLLFPSLGLIALRFASALCITAIAFVVYILLKNNINRWYIFLGVFICILNPHCLLVLHYNYTSALIAVLIALFLFKAVTTDKVNYMLFAGTITGMGFLFRLPNVCLCGMIAILIPYYIYTRSIKQTCKFLGYAILGVVIGLSINAGIIFLLNHQAPFLEMTSIALSYLTKTDSTHNSLSLVHTYTSQIKELITFIAFFLAFPLVDHFAYNKIHNKWLASGLRILLFVLFIWKLQERFYRVILLYAFCAIGLPYTILSSRKRELVYLSSLALLIMILLPLGSDNGFYNVGNYALYMALPLSIGSLFDNGLSIFDNKSYQSVFKKYILLFFVYVITTALFSTLNYCMHDSGSRLQKTSRPTLTVAHTTYTTEEQTSKIDSLFCHLRPVVNEDTYLLAYPSIPAVNYMSLTKPYLTQPWIGIMDYNTFCLSFEKAQKSIPLPIIVISKASAADWSSKNEQWHSILDCQDHFPSTKEKNEYLLQFVQENNYSVKWEDDYFQILIPPAQVH